MNSRRFFALAAAPCFTACLALEPTESLESGKAALSPPVCEARAEEALSSCQSKCDDALDEADGVREQCFADANADLALYLQYVVDAANDAELGSVGADIQACWDTMEFSDCAAIRDAVQRYIEDSGIAFDAEKAAAWNELGCNLDNFTRNWGYATCLADRAGAIGSEVVDTAELGIALRGLKFEAAQWLGWIGFCHVQRGAADVGHWGCASVGCEVAQANEYAACRGECLGELGTACVPAGFPAWVDCGVWVQRPASDALGGACDCASDIFATGECAAWDWENGLFGDRTLNTPCRADSDRAGLMTFVVTKNDTGAPDGHEIRCVEVDEYGVPQVDLTTAASASGDDSCRWASDGECDEPRYCAYGTDRSDCGY